MGTPAAPPPPDPYKVASAEGASNVQTGIANSVLANPNTFGPTGQTTFSQSGEMQTITLPDGTTTQVPRYNQTTSLSPGEQGIFDVNQQTRQQIGNVGLDQSRLIGDVLGKPVDYSGLELDPNSFSADRQRVEQAMYERMQPQVDQRRNAEISRLTNQGLVQGTEAFDRAMGDVGRQENDLRLGITAAGLGEQQGLYGMARDAAGYEMQRRTQQQNQPINALTALMSGSQVSAPNVAGYNAPTIAGTNVGQNVYATAAMQQQQYQQEMQARNAMMGGLFGMGGMLGHGAMGAPQVQKMLWGA